MLGLWTVASASGPHRPGRTDGKQRRRVDAWVEVETSYGPMEHEGMARQEATPTTSGAGGPKPARLARRKQSGDRSLRSLTPVCLIRALQRNYVRTLREALMAPGSACSMHHTPKRGTAPPLGAAVRDRRVKSAERPHDAPDAHDAAGNRRQEVTTPTQRPRVIPKTSPTRVPNPRQPYPTPTHSVATHPLRAEYEG